jgi:hypothetical protein
MRDAPEPVDGPVLIVHRHRKLLARLEPINGEATAGYLTRLALANGFESARQLWVALRAPKGQDALDALKRAADLSPSALHELVGPYPGYWKILEEDDAYLFSRRFVRWCPACLVQSEHLRGVWQLKLSTGCALHGTELVEACSVCGAALPLARAGALICACGATFRATNSKRVAGWLELAVQTAARGEIVELAGAALSFRQLHRLIVLLGQFTISASPRRPGQIAGLDLLPVVSRLVIQAEHLLEDWPVHFNELLAAMQAQRAGSGRLPEVFGALYRVLYEDLREPCYQFLRAAFEGFIRDNWWGVLCRRNRRLFAGPPLAPRRVSLTAICRSEGLVRSVARQLCDAGVVGHKAIDHQSGRKTVSVERDEIGQFKSIAAAIVPLNRAATLMMLPEQVVRDMLEAEVVPALHVAAHRAGRKWRIRGDGIPMVSCGPSTEDVCPLNRLLRYGRLTKDQRIALIQDVLIGRLQAAGPEGAQVPLGAAQISIADFDQWRRSTDAQRGLFLSVDEAAERLGVKQQVGYGLVRRGLLVPEPNRQGALRVSVVAVHDFTRTFVSLSDLAMERRTSPRALMARLRVEPVTGPKVDGMRQYFYRRLDLQNGAAGGRDGT